MAELGRDYIYQFVVNNYHTEQQLLFHTCRYFQRRWLMIYCAASHAGHCPINLMNVW